MSLDDWHLIFVTVCLILVLSACAPLVMALLPRREEPFLVLAMLGEEGLAEHYYPGDDSQIEMGEEVRWTIYLYNHMGEPQYAAIRVKLLNSTILAPDSVSNNPSPAPVVYEVRRVLLNNETLFYPFSWSIEDVESVGNFLEIKLITVNGVPIRTQAIAEGGSNFRFILELWVYDEGFEDFRFGWRYGNEMHYAWNQIWFNVILPV